MIYGRYLVSIYPENQLYYKNTSTEIIINNTNIIVTVDTIRRKLILYLTDLISGDPITPVRINVYIDGKLINSLETMSRRVDLSIPVGVLEIYAEPSEQINRVYGSYKTTVVFINDTELIIPLIRVPIKINFFVQDILGTPLNANITISSTENTSVVYRVVSVKGFAEAAVPYGKYLVEVSAIYRESMRLTLQPTPQSINDTITLTITLTNKLAPVNLTLKDQLGTGLRGGFNAEIYADGKLYLKQIINKSVETIYVPMGYNVSLRLIPFEEISALYQPVTKDLGFVKDSLNTTIVIMRKTYRVSLTVLDDIGKPLVSKIMLTSLENSAYTYEISTDVDGLGVVSIPAGDYSIDIYSSGYEKYSDQLSIKSDINKKIILSPQLITLLLRFTYVYVGLAIILIVLGIALWLRRIVLRRLEEEII